MARLPLSCLLQQVFAGIAQDLRHDGSISGLPADPGRRRFLRQSICAAGAALLLPSFLEAAPPSDERCVIVGAGMAGLNAAWQLKKTGVDAQVYEAAARVGGRMFTRRDIFGPGITTDIGGEFVDASHSDILQLVQELGLELYDLRSDSLAPKTFWFDGRMLGEEDLRQAIQPHAKKILADIQSLPAIIDYTTAPAFRHLDELSISEYLQKINITGWLLPFLEMVLTREYGMEATEQSAINFLIMFEPPLVKDADYELFGQGHEIFKIKGGSQQLTDALYEKVRQQINLQYRLLAITQGASNSLKLHFENNGSRHIVDADQVILAIPFSVLRSVDLSGLQMPPAKEKCIREMGYGNSCKFIIGTEGKPWRKKERQGYCFTDLSFGCGWDSSQLQSEEKGSFTIFGGGRISEEIREAKKESLLERFLPALETIYPGMKTAFTGQQTRYCWAGNPFSKAGYSSFKKGQWSSLAGWEAVAAGRVQFAGEHVSREFQGYMNGAAQTGRMAAAAVLADRRSMRQNNISQS